MIDIHLITPERQAALQLPNEDFPLIGQLLPSYKRVCGPTKNVYWPTMTSASCAFQMRLMTSSRSTKLDLP